MIPRWLKACGSNAAVSSRHLEFSLQKYMEDTKQFVPCLKSVEDIKQQEKDQILERLINEGLYISSACNKLISASFLKKMNYILKKELPPKISIGVQEC